MSDYELNEKVNRMNEGHGYRQYQSNLMHQIDCFDQVCEQYAFQQLDNECDERLMRELIYM